MANSVTVFDSMDAPSTTGTYLVGYLSYGITYDMLVEYLGNPTFLPEDSGDGKVNFEWVVEFNDELFTIYDWKSPSPEWAKENLGREVRWHVGGKEYAGDFINYIEELVASEE